jgi:hypothetical protein
MSINIDGRYHAFDAIPLPLYPFNCLAYSASSKCPRD